MNERYVVESKYYPWEIGKRWYFQSYHDARDFAFYHKGLYPNNRIVIYWIKDEF